MVYDDSEKGKESEEYMSHDEDDEDKNSVESYYEGEEDNDEEDFDEEEEFLEECDNDFGIVNVKKQVNRHIHFDD